MQAEGIIQAAREAGITDPDIIFCRVRDELCLTHKETRLALAEANFRHDGLLDPRRATLNSSQLSYGFGRF